MANEKNAIILSALKMHEDNFLEDKGKPKDMPTHIPNLDASLSLCSSKSVAKNTPGLGNGAPIIGLSYFEDSGVITNYEKLNPTSNSLMHNSLQLNTNEADGVSRRASDLSDATIG